MRTGICIPLCNPGPEFPELIRSLDAQKVKIDDVLLIDSSCRDIDAQPNCRILRIDPQSFDHGGTRRKAVEFLEGCDRIVFLTQDAVLADPFALRALLRAFDDPVVGAAYGRQIPRADACQIERHARHFNYPRESLSKSIFDIPRMGLKAAFISNSFAAYRREALQSVGNFPEHTIVSEDTCVAARMLLRGWKVKYCADAAVIHSHRYTMRQEFQRYFDIGVFHAREPWVRREFSNAEGEGWRFAVSELRHLMLRKPLKAPVALIRTPLRYLGFRLGLLERHLPMKFKCRLSMQKKFWAAERGTRAIGRKSVASDSPAL